MPPITETITMPQRANSYREALHAEPRPRGGPAPHVVLRSGMPALVLLLGDMLLWGGLFMACLWGLQAFASGSNFPNSSVIIIPLAVSLLSSWLVGAYDRDTDFHSLRFASEFLLAGLFATVFGAGLTALFGSYGSTQLASRFLLLATPFAFTVTSLVVRRQLSSRTGWDLNGVRRVLLLGSAEEAASLQRALLLAGRPAEVERMDPVAVSAETLSHYLKHRRTEADPGTVPLVSQTTFSPPASDPAPCPLTPLPSVPWCLAPRQILSSLVSPPSSSHSTPPDSRFIHGLPSGGNACACMMCTIPLPLGCSTVTSG